MHSGLQMFRGQVQFEGVRSGEEQRLRKGRIVGRRCDVITVLLTAVTVGRKWKQV
jgi:hypothetical protein